MANQIFFAVIAPAKPMKRPFPSIALAGSPTYPAPPSTTCNPPSKSFLPARTSSFCSVKHSSRWQIRMPETHGEPAINHRIKRGQFWTSPLATRSLSHRSHAQVRGIAFDHVGGYMDDRSCLCLRFQSWTGFEQFQQLTASPGTVPPSALDRVSGYFVHFRPGVSPGLNNPSRLQ